MVAIYGRLDAATLSYLIAMVQPRMGLSFAFIVAVRFGWEVENEKIYSWASF